VVACKLLIFNIVRKVSEHYKYMGILASGRLAQNMFFLTVNGEAERVILYKKRTLYIYIPILLYFSVTTARCIIPLVTIYH